MRVNSSVVVGSSFLEYIMRHFVQCDKSQCQILYVDNVYHLVFRKNKCLSPVIVSTSHLKYILRLFIMILLFFQSCLCGKGKPKMRGKIIQRDKILYVDLKMFIYIFVVFRSYPFVFFVGDKRAYGSKIIINAKSKRSTAYNKSCSIICIQME